MPPKINRRNFLKKAATASIGVSWMPNILTPVFRKKAIVADPSECIVRVIDDRATSHGIIQKDVIQMMLNEGIQALSGESDVREGWNKLLPDLNLSSDIISIKVNGINSDLPTHPEVVDTIVNSLKGIGFNENNIIIWDRGNADLIRSGYIINESNTGVRCFGSGRHGIFEYDPNPVSCYDETIYLSKFVTEYSKYIINASCLKASGVNGAGVTLCLKNMYGALSLRHDTYSGPGVGKLHDNHCDPYIPALNAHPLIRGKQVLFICDAIFGVIKNNLSPPDFTYNGLLLGTDPVALDTLGTQILIENGCMTTESAVHLVTASKAPYSLGRNDISNIEIIDIINPMSKYENDYIRQDGFQLHQNYPNPFNPTTHIPFELAKESKVKIEIFNAKGQFIRSLIHRRFSPGLHVIQWDGKDLLGMKVNSGHYLYKLSTSDYISTKRMIKTK